MTLTINHPVGGGALSNNPTSAATTTTTTAASTTHLCILRHHHYHDRSLPSSISLSSRTSTHVVSATGKFTPRTGKFDSKNRRGSSSSTTTKEESTRERKKNFENNDEIEGKSGGIGIRIGDEDVIDGVDDGYFLPELPGDKPDFWEGPQWDALGFFVQYMWAFGIVFALIACGIAVVTYNEGATDFRQTPAYKEAIQSKDLLEEGPEADVFESNPTEEAPALE